MDLFDFRDYLLKYKLGKSSSVHEFRVVANNIVSARSELLKCHRDGLLYPKGFSAFQKLKIVSISDVS